MDESVGTHLMLRFQIPIHRAAGQALPALSTSS